MASSRNDAPVLSRYFRATQFLAVLYVSQPGSPLYVNTLAEFTDELLRVVSQLFPRPTPGGNNQEADSFQIVATLLLRIQNYRLYELKDEYLRTLRFQQNPARRKRSLSMDPAVLAGSFALHDDALEGISLREVYNGVRGSLGEPTLVALFDTWIANAPYPHDGWKGNFAAKYAHKPCWTTQQLRKLDSYLDAFREEQKLAVSNEELVLGLHWHFCREAPEVAPSGVPPPEVSSPVSGEHPVRNDLRERIHAFPQGEAVLHVFDAAKSWGDLEACPNLPEWLNRIASLVPEVVRCHQPRRKKQQSLVGAEV